MTEAFFEYDFLDDRVIEQGYTIYHSAYIDQPYILKLSANNWLCAFTKSDNKEGGVGTTIGISFSKDKGKTWSFSQVLEQPSGPSASYAIPYLTSFGRIYVFYGYNEDNITVSNSYSSRSDQVNKLCYKFSDDNGISWSGRQKLEIPVSAIDLNNEWQGRHQMFWSICKPVSANSEMYFAFTKIGNFSTFIGEGWIAKCANINTEPDASKLNWSFFPSSAKGIRTESMGYIQEEHNIVPLNNGNFYCVYRTAKGYPAESYSKDGCKTWDRPVYAKYDNGYLIKNPRACTRVFKCANGKYLLWFHNNSTTWFGYRNPAWISGGIEKNGIIKWSQPEILLYSRDTSSKNSVSYPDLIEDSGDYYISETQKEQARIHKIQKGLIEDLWGQGEKKELIKNGLISHVTNFDSLNNTSFGTGSANWNGFTIELAFNLNSLNNQVILSTKNSSGNYAEVSVTDNGALALNLFRNNSSIYSFTANLNLKENKQNTVTIAMDDKSRIITIMLNGNLYDGGNADAFGWKRVPFNINYDIFNSPFFTTNFAGRMKRVKVYNRYLSTSEQVSNYYSN